MRNKAQVTVFIILGLVVLLSLTVLIYMEQQKVERVVIKETEEALKLPAELQPVNQLAASCIKRLAYEAFKKLGEQAGYINPAEFEITAANEAVPTESKSIKFSPDVPYWWFLSSENKCDVCSYKLNIPPLYSNEGERSVESQVSKYITQNIGICLDNFNLIKSQGFDVKILGGINVITNVRDSDIIFSVEYPAEFTKGEFKQKIEKYFATIDLRFKQVYELAEEIALFEKNNKSLELMTLEIISNNMGKEDGTLDNELPPVAGDSISVGEFAYWIMTDVKQDLEQDLNDNINFVQAVTDPNQVIEPYTDYFGVQRRNPFMFPTKKVYPRDLSVNFEYLPLWPIYLDVTPNKGLMIETSTVFNPIMPFVGVTDYNFAYDVSYPVLVEVTDTSFEHNDFPGGYKLRFALEVNLRNNEPLDPGNLPLAQLSYPITMLCNRNQMDSGDIAVNVADASNNNAVDEAVVSFVLGDRSCALGMTSSGAAVVKAPTGAIGALSVAKQDYFTYSEPFMAGDDNRQIDVLLEPFREREIVVKKLKATKLAIPFRGSSWGLLDTAVPKDLAGGETAVVTLTRVGELGEEGYTAFANYNAGASDPIRIKLVPGEYTVSINVIKTFSQGESFVIPQDIRNVGTFPFSKTIVIPEIKFDTAMPTAGVELNESASWDFDKTELDSSSKVIFYVVGPDLSQMTKHEDLGELGRFDTYSMAYSGRLMPRFG